MNWQSELLADDEAAFKLLNYTELHQLCGSQGISVSPTTHRKDLIAYLIGERLPERQDGSEADSWRHGIMGFLLEHWAVVQAQLTCPAQSKDPRACFGCVDAQVAHCLSKNKKYLHEIQKHRKPERTTQMTESNRLNADTAPRDLGELAGMSTYQLRGIVADLEAKGIAVTSNAEEKRALYSSSDANARAEKVLAALIKWDDKNGGGGDSEEEEEEAKEPPKRQPVRTGSKPTGGTSSGAAAGGGAQQVVDLAPLQDDVKALGKQVKELNDKLNVALDMNVKMGGMLVMMTEFIVGEPASAVFDDLMAQGKWLAEKGAEAKKKTTGGKG